MPRPNQGFQLSDAPNAFGVYEIRWSENGRTKRKSTGEKDRAAAQRVFAEFILAAADAKPAGRVTVAEVIDAYLADKSDVSSPATQRNDFGHLKSYFGTMRGAEIEQADARAYMGARAQGLVSFVDETGVRRGGTRAGVSTSRRELSMLLTAFNYAIGRKKFRDVNGEPVLSAHDKPVIELPPPPEPRDRWLSREEAARFLAAAQPADAPRLTRAYRFLAVILYTASRKGPVETLPWSRIDLERGLIDFRTPGERVTKKRRGVVPIAAELRPILERSYKERTSDWLLDRPGEPYHEWRRAARRAGLYADGKYTVSPHVLRHTFATWAAQDGVSLYDIAGVLHDTLATVTKHYAHHSPNHLRSAVDRRILSGV